MSVGAGVYLLLLFGTPGAIDVIEGCELESLMIELPKIRLYGVDRSEKLYGKV